MVVSRIAVTAAVLLGLSGCNNVVSIEPWFTAADTRGVPKFRDGLWVSVPDADCRVNVARPAERWPDCARATYVRDDERLLMVWDDLDGPRRRSFVGWQGEPSLIANGDPLIGQLEGEEEASTSPSDSSDVIIDEGGDGEPPWRYFYYAIRPTRFDDTGRVVAYESWGILCGPIEERARAERARRHAPVDGEPAQDANYVTKQPFPGLTVIGNSCTAESVDALRRAAVLSEPLETHGTARWVRDGWR